MDKPGLGSDEREEGLEGSGLRGNIRRTIRGWIIDADRTVRTVVMGEY